MSRLSPYLHAMAEHNAEVASWVGAIGAILTILAAWGLSRAEYLRLKRRDDDRLNKEIDLIKTIISEFEKKVAKAVELQKEEDAQDAPLIANWVRHTPEYDSMESVAGLVVNQWPSLEAYVSFKRYWSDSRKLLQVDGPFPVVVIGNPTAGISAAQKQSHDEFLAKVIEALETARP